MIRNTPRMIASRSANRMGREFVKRLDEGFMIDRTQPTSYKKRKARVRAPRRLT